MKNMNKPDAITIGELLDPPSISMRTTEYDNALQGWDDAKIK